jgi:hypothetical protein
MLNYSEQEFETLLQKNPALRVNQKYSLPGKRQFRGDNKMITGGEVLKEEVEQEGLAEILDRLGLTWFHVPNEGDRKPQYRAKLRRQGLKPGVPDVIIVDPPPAFPNAKGAAIELKRRKGGKVSEEQMDWIIKLNLLGWKTAVCKGKDEAIEQLKAWGYWKYWI